MNDGKPFAPWKRGCKERRRSHVWITAFIVLWLTLEIFVGKCLWVREGSMRQMVTWCVGMLLVALLLTLLHLWQSRHSHYRWTPLAKLDSEQQNAVLSSRPSLSPCRWVIWSKGLWPHQCVFLQLPWLDFSGWWQTRQYSSGQCLQDFPCSVMHTRDLQGLAEHKCCSRNDWNKAWSDSL